MNFKIKLVFLFFIITTISIKAQQNFNTTAIADTNQKIFIGASYNIETSAVQNDLANKFIYGGYINESIKENSFSKHQNNNTIQFGAHANLNYQSNLGRYFGVNNSFIGGSINQNILSFGNYSKDFFELTFYGNTALSNAILSDANFQAVNFQQYEVRFGWQKTDSTTNNIWQFNIAPSFIVGLDFGSGSTEDLTLTTSGFGSKVTLDGNLSVEFIDTTKQSLINGYGAGINFTVYHQRKKWQFSLLTQNLGIINWKDVSVNTFEGTYDFNGIEIQDIFNINDSIADQQILTDTLFKTTTKNQTKLLPFSIYLSGAYQLRENLQLNSDLRIVNTPNFIPQITTGVFQKNDIFNWGAKVGYGGYTSYLVGVMGGITIQKFNLNISSNNILGFITPSQSNNQNLSVSLSYHW